MNKQNKPQAQDELLKWAKALTTRVAHIEAASGGLKWGEAEELRAVIAKAESI